MSELFSKKLAWGVALIIFALLSCANLGLAAPAPKIWFTKVSPYGDANGYAWGKVSGVSASNYVVLTYLEVEHVWWTKPSLAAPATNIAANGAWKVDITTGGIDQCATRVLVFLVPKTIDFTKHQCAPCCGEITILGEELARYVGIHKPESGHMPVIHKIFTVYVTDGDL